MIGFLILGFLIGLIPSVAMTVYSCVAIGDCRAIEANYRQFARTAIGKLKADLQEMTRFRDAEADRASANSQKIQQLQDELSRVWRFQDSYRDVRDKLGRIASIIDGDEECGEDEAE